MKKIALKLFLAAIPFLIIIATYLSTDPFGVVYHYTVFYDTTKKIEVYRNTDYISTEVFVRNYDTCKYDSYIFGSSRSDVFTLQEWGKHIDSRAYFHYSAHRESLYGIERKIAFLHKKGAKIKNALFVLDYQLLAVTTNFSEPVFRKHPLISGESAASFQFSEFKPYFFLFCKPYYIKWLLTRREYRQTFNAKTNEFLWWANHEAAIAKNPDSFYALRIKKFYKRSATQQYSSHVINQEQLEMLTNIKKTLDSDSTRYRIVINPLYDQKKIDTTDLRILRSIFGTDKVYDFSGINDMTQSIYNYYEFGHFRAHIANQMMDRAYRN